MTERERLQLQVDGHRRTVTEIQAALTERRRELVAAEAHDPATGDGAAAGRVAALRDAVNVLAGRLAAAQRAVADAERDMKLLAARAATIAAHLRRCDRELAPAGPYAKRIAEAATALDMAHRARADAERLRAQSAADLAALWDGELPNMPRTFAV